MNPNAPGVGRFTSVAQTTEALRGASYLADRGLATALYLAMTMGRPILLEGEAGVGKTEVAKTLARLSGAELIRLQCYEGIEANQVLYEWDYARQILATRLLSEGSAGSPSLNNLYGPEFMLERPLLTAIRAGSAAVLLIDELDRADDEFDGFLLEVLSDFTVSIPELGTTVSAEEPPIVVITSNRTRELHDALKRRCLFHWIDYPSVEREAEIIRLRAPHVSDALALSVAEAVARFRELDLIKLPGASESIDWAQALALLGADAVTSETAAISLGWVVKNREDLATVTELLPDLLDA